MIQLTVRCETCKSSITARNMRMTKKGISPTLSEILKQYNFVYQDNKFFCSSCSAADVKKAG